MFASQTSYETQAVRTQEEAVGEAAARFRELEAALAEADAALADDVDALPQLEAQLANANKQVGIPYRVAAESRPSSLLRGQVAQCGISTDLREGRLLV